MTARWDRIAASLDVEGLSIALGSSSVVGAVAKFGAHFDLDTAELPTTLASVLETPGGLYPYPAAAESLEVVSSLAADAAAGTGMQEVTVEGLDANWELASATVELNGITAVALPGSWRRTHRMYGTRAGSGGTNAGIVLVRVASAGASRIDIPVGFGQSVHGVYTVPAGFTAYVKTWNCVHLPKAAAEAVNAHVALITRENDVAGRPFRIRQTSTSRFPNDLIVPVEIPAMTDIELRVLDVDANNSQMAGTFQLVLLKAEEGI